jgi:hypothetical protein
MHTPSALAVVHARAIVAMRFWGAYERWGFGPPLSVTVLDRLCAHAVQEERLV